MNRNNLRLAIEIVEEYQKKTRYWRDEIISIATEQIKTYERRSDLFQKESLTETTHLIEAFKSIQELAAERNKLVSCDFNLFKMFHVKELIHSHVLAHLLNPNANHGQKHLFLNIFLDMLGILRNNDYENWVITVEKGRVDILLKRVHPHAVVVIENKSNYAHDQNHQLYRYWYQEIYKTICENHLEKKNIFDLPENRYQIIYLTPAHWKMPSNNSLQKPPNWSDDLPEIVPIKPKPLLIQSFITNWIRQSLNKLPLGNHRIREYVMQYMEFWT